MTLSSMSSIAAPSAQPASNGAQTEGNKLLDQLSNSANSKPLAKRTQTASSNTQPAADKPGVVLARVPIRNRAEKYTMNELSMYRAAVKNLKLDEPNAHRWMLLARMQSNVSAVTGLKPDKLFVYTHRLQDQLGAASVALAKSESKLAALERSANGWESLPHTRESNALQKARGEVQSNTAWSNSIGAEVDKLLNKPTSLAYMKPIDPEK